MKIIVLGSGTSQGIPIIGCSCKVCLSKDSKDHRLRSSIYIQSSKTNLLIDIGPDFRQQFLANKLETVDHILITHEHNDHIIGLDDIRAINFTQQKSIPIYASQRVGSIIKERFSYAFNKEPYPGAPRISLHELNNSTFYLEDLEITPINIYHGKLPILGFRVNNIAYVTDASKIPDNELDKFNDLDILIINALRLENHHSHFNLAQALEFIELVNPKKSYITHISHKMGLVADWCQTLPDNVYPLYDRMQLRT